MQSDIHVLDVVALREPQPQRGLQQGQVGTVVEDLGSGVFEVEFSDNSGRTYATAPLRAEQIMVLHYDLANAGNA